MRFRDVDLRGIPAVTKSGQKLGKLVAFEIDTVAHAVSHYIVARSSLLSALMPDELLIAPVQVVSLDDDLLVVEDEAVKERAEARAVPAQAEVSPVGGASMRDLE